MAQEPSEPTGTIGPTRFTTLAVAFVVGGLLGFSLVALTVRMSGTAPRVEWSAVGALVVIAGLVMVFAYSTYRTVHRLRQLMDPRRALNFSMLAKASALVGAFVAGGYLGFGLNFVADLDIPLPRERAIRSLLAAVAGVVTMVAGLLLERACRVPKDDPPP